MTDGRDYAMLGANKILHFHEKIAMIGADTLVTSSFWLYKQVVQPTL
jgi:hypothetical protein